jgi:hypothetical protein
VDRWRVPFGLPEHRVSASGTVVKVGYGELKWTETDDGYFVVSVCGVPVKVHRLVLTAFVGPCPIGMEGCHRDGDKANNRLSNLRWGTPKSNSEDRVRHGTQVRGERSHFSVLTEDDVEEMRAWYLAGGVRQIDLAERYGVKPETVYLVLSGKTWAHLPSAALMKGFSNRRGNGWKRLLKVN